MNKNIKYIKSLELRCSSCKIIFNIEELSIDFLSASYKARCKNVICKKYLNTFLMFHLDKDERILCSSLILPLSDEECGFYCDDFRSYSKESYENWIKLSNDNFLKLLIKYSEDSNLDYIIEKYNNLVLFQ